MKTIEEYFEIIDRDRRGVFSGEAFEKIVEFGDKSFVPKMLSYIDEDVNSYNGRKAVALMQVGYLADSNAEPLLLAYLGSSHPDLRFSAFCSLCEIAGRQMGSATTFQYLIEYIERNISNKKFSYEEVIEIAVMFDRLEFPEKEALLNLIDRSLPGSLEYAAPFIGRV